VPVLGIIGPMGLIRPIGPIICFLFFPPPILFSVPSMYSSPKEDVSEYVVYLPKTVFKRSVTLAAGSVRIFFSS